MKKELFDDLIAACNEAIEHEKGNIKLKSNIVSIPDEEIEMNQILLQVFSELSESNKKKTMQYMNELHQTANA